MCGGVGGVRKVLGVRGAGVESRNDATDFKTDDLFVQALLMSQVPWKPGRS